MPKDPTKPIATTRTEELRREIEQSEGAWGVAARRGRNFAWAVVIWAVFVAVVGVAAVLPDGAAAAAWRLGG